MSTIPERLEKLRAKMQEKGIDIYIIPTADFHQSEYVGEHFKAREYITGFTGSAGTAVVSKTEARLWTDGRYFIQAAKQLEGTTVELMKMGQPGVPKIGEYLETALAEGETVGFDGRVVSVTEGEEYEKILSKADADASKKLEDAKKMIDLEREKALNDLRASVTGLAMTATAKLLSEQAGPESDKKRYQAFLASAGEKHD